MSTPPEKIRIAHDDYHASHIGRTAAGDQFFATTPFVPAVGTAGREFVAVYLFHPDGRFKEAIIDEESTELNSKRSDLPERESGCGLNKWRCCAPRWLTIQS